MNQPTSLSLRERCDLLMAATSDLEYPGMTAEHLEGVYVERMYNLGLVDKYIELCRGSEKVVRMLRELRREIERE